MATRKRKTIGFRTEEVLIDAVNEIVNDSDSDNTPEFSSSEESESESANESDNENNILIPTIGFSKNDRQPRIPHFICNLGMQFAVENEANVMSYFDHYIPPKLIEIRGAFKV
jgi:hypothetical protein